MWQYAHMRPKLIKKNKVGPLIVVVTLSAAPGRAEKIGVNFTINRQVVQKLWRSRSLGRDMFQNVYCKSRYGKLHSLV